MAITAAQFATASLVGSIIGGAVGGFAAGLIISGGDIKAAGVGALSGGLFGGISGYFRDAWNLRRAAYTGLAGGASARLAGGRFSDGLRMSLLVSFARLGWEYTRNVTNRLKLLSVKNGGEQAVYNNYGELLTDGTRGALLFDGIKGVSSKLGDYFGMEPEGSVHGYTKYSGVARFINRVSKTHDFFNSVRYDWDTGYFRPFETRITAEAFELYSFAGMPVAGAYTALAHVAHLPASAYANLNRRYREDR